MNTTRPTLVLLAAGVGSRYGGLKQLDSFGPSGETIMEYSIFDALKAGFGKVVFVIRPDMEQVFRDSLGQKIEKRIAVRYVHQRIDALPVGRKVPEGRTKPWGTGQALLAAADAVSEPFVAANADDFYGRSAYRVIGDFLTTPAADRARPTYAMVGYRLRDTMSEDGTVSRGACQCDADGWLQSIVETTKIEKAGNDGRAFDETGQPRTIPGDTLVSMNFWGFQPGFSDNLRNGFSRFLETSGTSQTAEYYLPAAVQESMRDRGARVKVLQSSDAWCGVTHKHDKTPVESMLRRLVERGDYPASLWSNSVV
jgi:hypothetical protein